MIHRYCDHISSASLPTTLPDKRKSRDLWVFEGYDTQTHTHTQALFCFRLSITQIALQSITGTDLVSECFHMIQIQFPSRLASVDVDFPPLHEQFLDLHFGYRWTSMPITPMIQQNSLTIGLSYTTVVITHLIPSRDIESVHKWWLCNLPLFFSFILSIICCTPQPFACTLLLDSCYLSVFVNVT